MFKSFSWWSTLFGIRRKFGDVDHISTDTLNQWLSDNNKSKQILLVDSRPVVEYTVSHLENSLQVDFDAEDAVVDEMLEKNLDVEHIVCYCSVGYRSSVLARRLQQKLTEKSVIKPKVHNLDGSIFKWANERRPIIDADGNKTEKVHPYSATWGKLLDRELWTDF